MATASRSLVRLLPAFLGHLEAERGLSRHTRDAYRRDLERFGRSLPPPAAADLQAVGEREIVEFVVRDRREGRDPASIQRALSALRTFFRFLSWSGVTTRNPARLLESPRLSHRLPGALQAEEVRRLLSEAAHGSSRHRRRDRALLELLYATGLRVGEALDLRLEQVHWELEVVRCRGKGGRERIVPLTRTARACLREYLERERPRLVGTRGLDHVFLSRSGRPLGRETVNAMLKRLARQAGLAGRITPHTLRHSFATHLLAGGADLRVVQELLGHAKVETTEVYTHVDRSQLKAAHKKYHPRG